MACFEFHNSSSFVVVQDSTGLHDVETDSAEGSESFDQWLCEHDTYVIATKRVFGAIGCLDLQ